MGNECIASSGAGVAQNLGQAVDEAGLLLAYIAQKGLDIDQKMISTLVRFKSAVEKGKDDPKPEEEAEFWYAYQVVSHAVSPVTITSIKAGIDACGREIRTLRGGKQTISLARIAERRYRRIAVISLILLLFVQFYTGFGARLLNNLEKLEKEISTLRYKLRSLDDDLRTPGRFKTDDEVKEVKDAQSQLSQDVDSKEKDVKARKRLLAVWSKPFQFFIEAEAKLPASPATALSPTVSHGPERTDLSLDEADSAGAPVAERSRPAAVEGDSVDNAEAESSAGSSATEIEKLLGQSRTPPKASVDSNSLDVSGQTPNKPKDEKFIRHVVLFGQILLEALNLYFLPLVYGLLGACAYVLRTLSVETREYTYSPESEIRLRLRLYLGALSGFAVAWFINTETTPSLAESIKPLALAFLAGYSVEVLFAAMDRLVGAFSDEHRIKVGNP